MRSERMLAESRIIDYISELPCPARGPVKRLLTDKLKEARKRNQWKFEEYAKFITAEHALLSTLNKPDDLERRAEDEARLKEMRKSEDLVELPESRPSLPKQEDIADVTDQKEVKLTSAAGVPRMPPVCGQAEVASDAISESQPLD